MTQFLDAVRATSKFFMKSDNVHETLNRVTRRLEDEGIGYALVGGLALFAHGFRRYTTDVDILVTREGLVAVHKKLVGRGYLPQFQGARKKLRDTQTGVPVDFITTGEYPGDGKPKPVSFPDPVSTSIEMDGKRVIRLEKLLELKLASGMSAPHRVSDLGDVQRVIETLQLPREFVDKLDPSVRDKYVELWDAIRNATGPDRE